LKIFGNTYSAFVKKALAFLALALILILSIQSCQRQARYERVLKALQQSNGERDSLIVQVQEDGSKITEQEQTILTQKEAIESGLLEIDKLKNVKSQVRFVTQTVVDTFYAQVGEAVVDSSTNTLIRPFNYIEADNWFSVNGDFSSDFVRINSLTYRDEYQLTIADKKLGFFKKPKPSVILKSSNPYTDIQSMQNITITVENPWYKRPWVWGALGFSAGYLIK
jgi:hypothetical protein